MATYAEKLRDQRWLEYREKIIDRDFGRCCDCGSTSDLQVHHLAYWFGADPWDYEPEALRTLCKTCHERAEAERYYFLVDWGRLRAFQRNEIAREVADMLPKPPPKPEPEPDPFDAALSKWIADGPKDGGENDRLQKLIDFKRKCMAMDGFERREAEAAFRQQIIDLANAVEVETNVN